MLTNEEIAPTVRRVEPANGKAGEDEVFLSPRVVDQRAFEDLAGVLKSLLSEVREEASSLRVALSEAKAARTDITTASEKQRSQLELTAKLLKALGNKADAVDSASHRAEQRLEKLDSITSNLDETIEARLAAFDTRLTERLGDAERARDKATEAARTAADALSVKLEATAKDVETQATERLRSAQEETVQATNAMHTAAEVAVQRIADSVEDHAATADTQAASHMQQLKSMAARCTKDVEEAASHVSEELASSIERAEAIAGMRDAAGVTPLAEVAAHAQEAAEAARASLARIEDIRSEAAMAVTDLEDRLAEAKMLLDLAASRQDKATESLNETIETVANAERRMMQQAERAREVMEPIAQIRDEAHSEAERLLQIQDEASQTIDVSRSSAESMKALMIDLRDAASKLEPWRDLLLGRDVGERDLPKPLLDVVQRFRASIARDLSKMAAAMNMIAQQADTSVAFKDDAPELVIRPTTAAAPAASPLARASTDAMPAPADGQEQNDAGQGGPVSNQGKLFTPRLRPIIKPLRTGMTESADQAPPAAEG